MVSEILNSPVAIFIAILVFIHISVLIFMSKQREKRERKALENVKKELKQSENQLQQLFDTMHDNRRVLSENLKKLAEEEALLDTETELTESDE